jgi:hypothetical protein
MKRRRSGYEHGAADATLRRSLPLPGKAWQVDTDGKASPGSGRLSDRPRYRALSHSQVKFSFFAR